MLTDENVKSVLHMIGTKEIWRPILNREKYKQVLLWLLNSDANNVHLGKVKLFKLLYYVDFDHFEEFSSSVTGDIYRKLDYGPVPVTADRILAEMRKESLIVSSLAVDGPYQRNVFQPLAKASIDSFAPSEIAVIEQVIQRWAHHTRVQIVNATHGEAPWIAVNMREEIPYPLAFYRHQKGEADLEKDEEPDELQEVS